jgi:hypothetical protein
MREQAALVHLPALLRRVRRQERELAVLRRQPAGADGD